MVSEVPSYRSTELPSGATSNSSGTSASDLRDTGSSVPSSSSSAPPSTSIGSESVGRKRIAPESVTPNACTNCKKAKVKCDGNQPICHRCRGRNLEQCRYEIHTKNAKEQMVLEIQRLREKNEHLEIDLEHLQEEWDWNQQIFLCIKNNVKGPEIIRRLRDGESARSIAEWLGRPILDDVKSLSPASERQLSEAIDGFSDNSGWTDARYWTDVTVNLGLVEHLITLYLTWVQPVHTLLEYPRFIESFRGCDEYFCSSALVNAMCAMSCHLLHGPWNELGLTDIDVAALRVQFMDRARRLMKTTDYSKMTAIQTHAIMFLIDMGSGKALLATSYLRLAIESLAAKQSTDEDADSDCVAWWGIVTLNTAWSGLIYQKAIGPISPFATVFDGVDPYRPEPLWHNYREPGDYTSSPGRPSYSLLAAYEQAKLSRIIHETIKLYCGSMGRITAVATLKVYERYLNWEYNLPRRIGISGVDDEILPHVIFLHTLFHTAVVHLLQPLVEVTGLDDASKEFLRESITFHAKTGLTILGKYRRLYSSLYQSPLQLFCMVHLGDAMIRFAKDDTSLLAADVVRFCMDVLEEAKIGSPICGPLQQMFGSAALELGVPMPDDLKLVVRQCSKHSPEELLIACTRVTFKQPISQILPMLDPSLVVDFPQVWQRMSANLLGGTRSREKDHSLRIESLLNS